MEWQTSFELRNLSNQALSAKLEIEDVKFQNPKHQAPKGINCSIYHSQKFPASAKDCRKNWNVQARGCKTFYVHSKTPLAAFRMTASPGASLMVCSWKCWQIYTNMGDRRGQAHEYVMSQGYVGFLSVQTALLHRLTSTQVSLTKRHAAPIDLAKASYKRFLPGMIPE